MQPLPAPPDDDAPRLTERDESFVWREIVQSAMEGAPLATDSLEMLIDRMERQP